MIDTSYRLAMNVLSVYIKESIHTLHMYKM